MAEAAETALTLDVLTVVGPALVLRSVTLPLLIRAQQAVRRQALADPGTPPRKVPGAVVGELALGVAGGVGLWFALPHEVLGDSLVLGRPVVFQTGEWLSDVYGYSLAMAWILYVLFAALASVLWPVLWSRTHHTLVTTGVDGGSWTATPTAAGAWALWWPSASRSGSFSRWASPWRPSPARPSPTG
ncbi:hypothetical protein AB0D99_00285 [Streptomyces sp. NPDC047971]|uniref:hypothetical protein n=1 Tax=Streptomyces sp. NPDC047971 TaxID=3154499 RepID=UPI0033CDBC34